MVNHAVSGSTIADHTLGPLANVTDDKPRPGHVYVEPILSNISSLDCSAEEYNNTLLVHQHLLRCSPTLNTDHLLRMGYCQPSLRRNTRNFGCSAAQFDSACNLIRAGSTSGQVEIHNPSESVEVILRDEITPLMKQEIVLHRDQHNQDMSLMLSLASPTGASCKVQLYGLFVKRTKYDVMERVIYRKDQVAGEKRITFNVYQVDNSVCLLKTDLGRSVVLGGCVHDPSCYLTPDALYCLRYIYSTSLPQEVGVLGNILVDCGARDCGCLIWIDHSVMKCTSGLLSMSRLEFHVLLTPTYWVLGSGCLDCPIITQRMLNHLT